MKNDFQTALEKFLAGAQNKVANAQKELSPENHTTLRAINGRKYIKIARERRGTIESVFCFVDSTNGNVLKAESWRKPAPQARGNIFDSDNGVNAVSECGANYLK